MEWPTRWRDDPRAPDPLRAALRELTPATPPAMPADLGGAVRRRLSTAVGTGIGVVVLLLALVGAPRLAAPTPPSPPVATPTLYDAEATEVAAEPAVAAAPEPTMDEVPLPRDRRTTPPRRARGARPETLPPPSAEAPDEASILDEALRLLARDPARALALTDRHERLFPAGALSPEREVIRIEALERLGAHDDAAERAAELEPAARIHAARVESVLGREDP